MPTFAELLTSYMERTGIGDAELARRIPVSRPTLLRWKEGITTRPRYRDDVRRCAEVLRLTSEETDEFLLAAGFSPGTAVVPVATTVPASEEAINADDASLVAPEPADAPVVFAPVPRVAPDTRLAGFLQRNRRFLVTGVMDTLGSVGGRGCCCDGQVGG